jgi:peptidoglycan/LPS O-acetylase OafA/YrhL
LRRTAAPADARDNNFDALRLLAASTILVLHCWPITGRNVVPRVHGLALNAIAVMVFFSISGFLLAQSWRIEPRLWRFLAKRALRIYPALIVVLLLSTLVLGPAVTTLPLGDYFSHPQTLRYLTHNLVFSTQYNLPGFFPDNPIPGAVNGPLWTLSPEVRSYLMLAVAGTVGILRNRFLVLALAFLALIGPELRPEFAHSAMVAPLYVQCFCVGMLLYVWRETVPWNILVAAAVTCVFLIAGGLDTSFGKTLIDAFAIPYVTIFVAYSSPAWIRRITSRGDLSYGIYIFASPIQETVMGLWGRSLKPVGLLAIAFPITLLFALASWVAVERPALRLKRRFSSRRPRAQAPSADVAESPA